MNHNYPTLYRISLLIHGLVKSFPFVAKLYLILVGKILRNTPNFPLKQNIFHSVRDYNWQKIKFKAKKVNVIPSSNIYIIPHVGEFDFNALFSRSLGYEQELFLTLSKRLDKYDAIIEVGANVGVFTNFFSKELEKNDSQIPIFAFEPSTTAYFRLLQNIESNNAQNIYPFNVALHEKAGFLDFFQPEGHLTNGSIDAEFANIFSNQVKHTIVPALSEPQLSELLKDYSKILMKIDVEGAEEIILNNLQPLILNKQTDIVLEVLKPYENSLNSISFLENNYIFYLISEQGLVKKQKFEADPHHRDYLLVPNNTQY